MNKPSAGMQSAIKLQLFRMLLCLPVNEAASMFVNMSEQHWRDLEAGLAPVPSQVLDKMESLYTWRCDQIVIMRSVLSMSPDAQVFEFWPQNMDDWMAIEGNEPEHFRPCQSLYAAIMAEYPKQFTLIPFDLQAFSAWAHSRPATLELQSEYLAYLTEPQNLKLS